VQRPKWIRRTVSSVATAYRQSKRPIGVILVFIAALGSVLPSAGIQIAALTALGGIILEVLFEIQSHTIDHARPRSFGNFYDVSLHIQEQIWQRIKRNRRIKIQAIGMSMGHAWPFLSDVLRKILDESAGAIDLHLAIIDSSWDQLAQINPHWGHTADGNVARISSFADINQARLVASGSHITVSRYAHMPNWHGVLLDEEVLFESTCIWQGEVLAGAENEYELHVMSDTSGAARITRFKSWFNYATRNLAHRWPQALEARAPIAIGAA
jgi:hypothetical protein